MQGLHIHDSALHDSELHEPGLNQSRTVQPVREGKICWRHLQLMARNRGWNGWRVAPTGKSFLIGTV